MQSFALSDKDAAARSIAAAAFPSYNGRKFRVTVHDAGGMNLASYWDGGSRSYYAILRLSDMKTLEVPQNGSGFDPYGYGIETPLPAPDFAVIECSIFCGNDSGITIHVHSSNAAPLLPKVEALSWAETVVLVATRGLKSSYAGIKDYRFHESHERTGISRQEWDEAKAQLISRKLLNAAGAITVDGKNAAGGKYDLYSVPKREAFSAA